MTTEDSQKVVLSLDLGEDASVEEVHAATTQLMRELMNSSADEVEKMPQGDPEEGAKGDPITLGAIALALGAAAAPEIIKIVHSWITRRHSHNVSLKIKLGQDEIEFTTAGTASADELEQLTDRFALLLKKHASSDV